MSTRAHKADAPTRLRVGVLTVSTTRGLDEDQSGHWIAKSAGREGHTVVFHQVVTDDRAIIARSATQAIAAHALDSLLVNGGTGLSPADVTIEALRPLFDKELTGFAILFTHLSFDQVDSAAMLSRAAAGTMAGAVVFCMPGSLKACQLACRELIFPELGHILRHLRKG